MGQAGEANTWRAKRPLRWRGDGCLEHENGGLQRGDLEKLLGDRLLEDRRQPCLKALASNNTKQSEQDNVSVGKKNTKMQKDKTRGGVSMT